MKTPGSIRRFAFALFWFVGTASLSFAQAPAPPDPWPRQVPLAHGTAIVYQPQVEAWDGNQIKVRAAVALQAVGSEPTVFGAVFATARTQVDKAARTVVFSDIQVTRSSFPTLADQGAALMADFGPKLAAGIRTISLDRVEASLKATGVQPPSFPVKNDPPRIIVSYSTAILVPIDGPPRIAPVPADTRVKRVINTHALILQAGLGDDFYLHVYDGWLTAPKLEGPWTQARRTPIGMDEVAKKLAASGIVDMLDGGPNAKPKPRLDNGVPTIYTTQVPTELVVFKGQPNLVPITGTQLLWASNTGADVLVDTTTSSFYILLSGRWFRAASPNGPWTFVASNALPADFAKIPLDSPASIVLAAVAGTPQAQEAVIANSVPTTATIPRANGPKFEQAFDGAPHFEAIADTPLFYTDNSSVPVIQVDRQTYLAVSAGAWFIAPTPTGPWSVATSIPSVIYTIPTSSPLHYVTYVRVYGATPQVVYVGYTPGYMGTVVAPYGTVVYGTGYVYSPWVGTVWYPPPYTYGIAAVPVYSPALGFTYGFAVGLATAAWVTPYYGAAYHPYPCCGSASASVYGQYGNTAYSGTKTAYASANGTVGVSGSGSYYNKATGTSGNYATNKSYNPYTGVAKQSGAVSGTTAAGGSGTAAAGRSYNTETGQRTAGSSFSATGAGGSSVDHTGATTAGPQGYGHTGSTTVDNANTGQTKSYGSGANANDHYADASGNVYKGSSSSGWQQSSASGWSKPSGDTSAMDRESAARSSGAEQLLRKRRRLFRRRRRQVQRRRRWRRSSSLGSGHRDRAAANDFNFDKSHDHENDSRDRVRAVFFGRLRGGQLRHQRARQGRLQQRRAGGCLQPEHRHRDDGAEERQRRDDRTEQHRREGRLQPEHGQRGRDTEERQRRQHDQDDARRRGQDEEWHGRRRRSKRNDLREGQEQPGLQERLTPRAAADMRTSVARALVALGIAGSALLCAQVAECRDAPVAIPAEAARPGAPGPTRVAVGIWIADISRIDSAEQTFNANLVLTIHWRDPVAGRGPSERGALPAGRHLASQLAHHQRDDERAGHVSRSRRRLGRW
jgi:hypothetical protein